MPAVYQVGVLSPEHAAIVYPLVLAAFPTVELGQWRNYARTVMEAPPDRVGILGLRNGAGYFCGLLIYRNEREPWHEPRLSIDLFLALDLIEVETAIDALLTAAEAKAIALGCVAVQIRLEHKPDVRGRVRRAGYRTAAELMTKAVPVPPARN